MNVKIGTKIKALRKRDDITQEKLADALGVTCQAISKWENETGYPDIEYITPIANFFNVTTDFLFSHDTAEKQRKIDDYCKQYDAHNRERKPVEERIDLMRQALAEFPAEENYSTGLRMRCITNGMTTVGIAMKLMVKLYLIGKSINHLTVGKKLLKF